MHEYMVVERFRQGRIKELYERFDTQGRMLPEGVEYVDSWIDEKVERCFQLMRATSRDVIVEWTKQWDDLADFEIIQVIGSNEARRIALEEDT